MKSILLVEDDAELQHVVKTLLSMEGYRVVVAENGRCGERLYRSEKVDLVITDIVMPEQDGLELIETLSRDFPGTKILAVSGGAGRGKVDYLKVSQHLGARATLSKPFRAEELLETVRALLQN